MHIEKVILPSAVLVKLAGRFEFGTRNDYKRVIGQIVQEGHHRLILDLEQVTFLDSSALGLLLLTDQNFKLKQGSLGLVRPAGYVRQVLDLANLPKVIPVYESVDDAVNAVPTA
jgi:anti-sigma B factor antagonist